MCAQCDVARSREALQADAVLLCRSFDSTDANPVFENAVRVCYGFGRQAHHAPMLSVFRLELEGDVARLARTPYHAPATRPKSQMCQAADLRSGPHELLTEDGFRF